MYAHAHKLCCPCRLGFCESDAQQLLTGSGALGVAADGCRDVDYESFIRWLMGACTADVMDSQLQHSKKPPVSLLACAFRGC